LSSKTKKILGAVVALAVVGSVVGFSVSKENRSKVTIQTGKAEKKDLTQVVTASGEVRPRRYVNVGANVSGRLIDISVVEGQRVKKGQMLARVEAERYEAGARQGEAGVAAARAELSRSEADMAAAKLAYDRNKRMRDEKLVADSVFDQAEAEYKMKQASVEAARRRIAQLQAQLDTSKDELYKTTVYSPMDGVVTNLPKEEGEMVIGAQSFNPTVIMTVADLSVMECEVMVDETDFRNLKVGQEAKVKVEALEGPGDEGRGDRDRRLGAGARQRQPGHDGDPGEREHRQPAEGLQGHDHDQGSAANLRPGLNATADITTATRSAVIAVPVQAVVVREVNKEGKVVDPDAMGGGQAREGDTVTQVAREKGLEKDGVFVVDGDKAHFKPVKTGIMGDTDIEITEGIGEGQTIVTGSYKTLRNLKDDARIKTEQKGKKS
jgi:HlyD family secretion protein